MGNRRPEQLFTLLAFIVGFALVVALMGIAIQYPEPSRFQYLIFRVVLSLAAAAFTAALIPGLVNMTINAGENSSGLPITLGASGAIVILILVYVSDPASRIIDTPSKEPTTPPQIMELSLLRGNLGVLEGKWERLDEGQEPCQSIREDASALGEQFHNIQDSDLEGYLGHQIAKYHYAQYAYLIAADVECEESKGLEYVQTSMDDGAVAMKLYKEVQQLPPQYKLNLQDWLKQEFTIERVTFHTAIGYALLYRYGQMVLPDAIAAIRSKLSEIDESYYSNAGISRDKNRILEPFLSKSPADAGFSDKPCKLGCASQRTVSRKHYDSC